MQITNPRRRVQFGLLKILWICGSTRLAIGTSLLYKSRQFRHFPQSTPNSQVRITKWNFSLCNTVSSDPTFSNSCNSIWLWKRIRPVLCPLPTNVVQETIRAIRKSGWLKQCCGRMSEKKKLVKLLNEVGSRIYFLCFDKWSFWTNIQGGEFSHDQQQIQNRTINSTFCPCKIITESVFSSTH